MKKLVFALLALSGLVAAQISLKHELGAVELATLPKRLVVLEYSFVDALAALGTKPVGAAIAATGGDRGVPPYLTTFVQGVTAVGSRAQPNLEAILALRPDLIVADLTRRTLYEQLQRIAPTIVYKSQDGDYDESCASSASSGESWERSAWPSNC